jgi:hypothetical protein
MDTDKNDEVRMMNDEVAKRQIVRQCPDLKMERGL